MPNYCRVKQIEMSLSSHSKPIVILKQVQDDNSEDRNDKTLRVQIHSLRLRITIIANPKTQKCRLFSRHFAYYLILPSSGLNRSNIVFHISYLSAYLLANILYGAQI